MDTLSFGLEIDLPKGSPTQNLMQWVRYAVKSTDRDGAMLSYPIDKFQKASIQNVDAQRKINVSHEISKYASFKFYITELCVNLIISEDSFRRLSQLLRSSILFFR